MDLTTFFEQLPLGTYRLQMDGTVLRINTAFAQLHGYPDPAAFQRHAGSQLQALYQDPEQWHQLQTLLHSQGRARNFVSRWTCHKTGATLWVKENAHLVCDANQTPLFYEGTVEDVSTERLAVTALREQEAILRSLLQAIPDQVWLKDLYGSYLACNDSYANALGLPVERIIGTVDADHPAAAMAAHYFVADDTVIRKGKPVSYEVDIRAAGKNAYDTYEIIKAPLRNNAGTVLGVVGMARRVPVSRHSTPPVVHDSTPEESHLLGDDWGGWEYDVLGERGFRMDARAWQILAYPESERSKGQLFGELMHPEDQAEALRCMRQHLEGQTPTLVLEYRALNFHGQWIWLNCRGKIIETGSDGTPLRLAGTVMDITARKSAECELRNSNAELQSTLNALPDLLFELTPNGICRAVHCMDTGLLVLPAAELRDKKLRDVLPAEAAAVYQLALDEACAEGSSHGRQYCLQLHGDTRWFELSIVCKPATASDEPRLVAIARDITERKTMDDAIAHLAFHDALTGLPNRRLLVDRLQRAIRSSSRSQHYGALLFLDLDHFKEINDRHGHQVGDQLLQEIGRRLQQSIREIDSVARLGGDEFVVLINDLSEDAAQAQAQVAALAQKILGKIDTPFLLKQVPYCISSSVGATLFKGDSNNLTALLQQADSAMYQAKAAGRNTLRFYSHS